MSRICKVLIWFWLALCLLCLAGFLATGKTPYQEVREGIGFWILSWALPIIILIIVDILSKKIKERAKYQ